MSFQKELLRCHINHFLMYSHFSGFIECILFSLRCAWYQGEDHVALGPHWQEWPTHSPA